MSSIKLHVKIQILLYGELIHMNSKTVRAWFAEAFQWVDETERFKLGAKLRDAKQRWENQLLPVTKKELSCQKKHNCMKV